MNLRWVPITATLLACGTLLPQTDGGPADANVVDVVDVIDVDVADASADVAKADATIDAPMDVSDGAKAKLDAPYVDLDAATKPWVATVPNATFYGVAVDSNLNVLVGGEINSSGYRTVIISEYASNGTPLWS